MRCLVLALFVTACSQPAPPPPAPPVVAAKPVDAAPAPPTEPLAAPEVEPVDAGAPEPLANPDTGPRATFQCFSWVHGPDFSTDCYRTAEACEVERKKMEAGARPTQPCKSLVGASCTMVGRRKMRKEERCFANANNCERYRSFVTGNGLDVTACTEK